MHRHLRSVVAAATLALAFFAGPLLVGDVQVAYAESESPRGWLGVGMSPIRGGVGVEVKRVVRNSPAARAGVRVGDHILRADGARAESPTDVTRAVRAHPAGHSVVLDLVREGRELALTVSLVAAPSPDDVLRMDHVGGAARAWTRLKGAHGVMPSSIAALEGRVVVLDFWATWCGPCRVTGPVLDGWQRQFGAQGLSVVGISAEASDTVAAHGARNATKYALAADEDGETSQSYGVSSLPTVFVIDKKGVVRDVFVGYDPARFAKAEALIRTLLAEPGRPR